MIGTVTAKRAGRRPSVSGKRCKAQAFKLHSDETIEDLKEITRSDKKVRSTLGLRVFRPRTVNMAGYDPDTEYRGVSFRVSIQIGRRRVPPSTIVMFDEDGPIGTFSPQEFRELTALA